MSGTPETDAAVMAAGGDWSFPLRECSRRLERQRDEAQEKYANLATEHMLSINKICNERDDALSQIAQAECRAERFCQERDEAREALRKAIRFVEAYEPHSRGVEVDQNETLNIIRKALEETK